MRSKLTIRIATPPCLLVVTAAVVRAAESESNWEIQGSVVDNDGQPIDEFDVATFWPANGQMWDEQGKFIRAKEREAPRSIWKNEGELVPFPIPNSVGKHAARISSALPPATARGSRFSQWLKLVRMAAMLPSNVPMARNS